MTNSQRPLMLFSAIIFMALGASASPSKYAMSTLTMDKALVDALQFDPSSSVESVGRNILRFCQNLSNNDSLKLIAVKDVWEDGRTLTVERTSGDGKNSLRFDIVGQRDYDTPAYRMDFALKCSLSNKEVSFALSSFQNHQAKATVEDASPRLTTASIVNDLNTYQSANGSQVFEVVSALAIGVRESANAGMEVFDIFNLDQASSAFTQKALSENPQASDLVNVKLETRTVHSQKTVCVKKERIVIPAHSDHGDDYPESVIEQCTQEKKVLEPRQEKWIVLSAKI